MVDALWMTFQRYRWFLLLFVAVRRMSIRPIELLRPAHTSSSEPFHTYV